MFTYKNPWHQPGKSWGGPPVYTRQIAPIEYKGCRIFRVCEEQSDVVNDGVCLTQVVSLKGAKEYVDDSAQKL